MAPNKTELTLDALDEQTALELPDRELMCGGTCTSLVNVNLAVGANVSLSGITATTGCVTTAGTGGITLGIGAVLTTGSTSCS